MRALRSVDDCRSEGYLSGQKVPPRLQEELSPVLRGGCCRPLGCLLLVRVLGALPFQDGLTDLLENKMRVISVALSVLTWQLPCNISKSRAWSFLIFC